MWEYNELYHHGIEGQKWGVRRFQNKDGTLTIEGIKRYRREEIEHDVNDIKKQAAEIKRQSTEVKVNRLYKKEKRRILFNRMTLGLSPKYQIKMRLAKRRAENALAGAAKNYNVVYDSKNDKYIIKEKGRES